MSEKWKTKRLSDLDGRDSRLADMEPKVGIVRQTLRELEGVNWCGNIHAFDVADQVNLIIQIFELMVVELATFYSA